MKRLSFLLAVSFAAGICLLPAQTDLPARLDAISKGYGEKRNFMGTVLVAKGGAILLEKGYGYANLEWDVPNPSDAKFRLGSITKQFTATAILQLQEQGKLSVDDPISKYVENAPEAWKGITIHHLLSHTSGIPSYTGFPDFVKPQVYARAASAARDRDALERQGARVSTRREVEIRQYGLCASWLHHRKGLGREVCGLP